MQDVLGIILGGGRGNRLFPLTRDRSKPAVPIGGKYRLIDIPISNCLHSGIRRIFVLTQFNSASLNRHIGQTYRMDPFSRGFVEILAAEQTPDNASWFQGTADAVRQARRHFEAYDADQYLILAGDHLYRMDYGAMVDAHVERRADITIAAQPVVPTDATEMGIFSFDREGQIVAFDEKPTAERLAQLGSSAPPGALFTGHSAEKPFIASMGIYVFSRQILLDVLEQDGIDFGKEIIPAALARHRVHAYLFKDYWADVGTIESFFEANLMLARPEAPFHFYDPRRPVFARPRFLPPSTLAGCHLQHALVADGCAVGRCRVDESVLGVRSVVADGAHIRRAVVLGADYYEGDDEAPPADGAPRLGIGRDAVVDGVIVDKNARIGDGVRLVNERRLSHADGPGYFIRGGIIIVPKGGVVSDGTIV